MSTSLGGGTEGTTRGRPGHEDGAAVEADAAGDERPAVGGGLVVRAESGGPRAPPLSMPTENTGFLPGGNCCPDSFGRTRTPDNFRSGN